MISSLFVVCWYPLYVLTLVDPKFEQSTKLYKVLTLVAWSNATLNPIVLLLFDYNVGTSRRLGCCARSKGQVVGSQGQWVESGRRRSIYERVGNRLCNEGQQVAETQRVNGLLDSSVEDLAQHQQVPDDITSQPWLRM